MPVLKKKQTRKFVNFQHLLSLCTLDNIKLYITSPSHCLPMILLLFLIEMFLCIAVVLKVPYTEIDWKAYMQEVEGFMNGTYNYSQLKGDTGPLVYPAGFLYVYSLLYKITNAGENIRLAQFIFCIFYWINLALVMNIYRMVPRVPPFALAFMCLTSYRLHSIFVLRLFNDPVAMIFFYASVNLMLCDFWELGCLLFSLAVSVKMNILLFSFGLFAVMLRRFSIQRTFLLIFICAMVQLCLGLPFLLHAPIEYIVCSFNLGRIFIHKWTVNWRFVPPDIFVSKAFHLALFTCHLGCILVFAIFRWKPKLISRAVSNHEFLLILFTSNFIGMTFSRSLHYQFYVWYYHTLPFLLWSTDLSNILKLLLWGVLELCWNTYPSTELSSALLHVCHFVLLVLLWRRSGQFESDVKDE